MYEYGTFFSLFPSINLINGTNFFVVIIALIIAFFLLGLLFGLRASKRKKSPKKNERTARDTAVEQPQQIGSVEQDNQEDEYLQNRGQYDRKRNSNRNYYNNYW